MSSVDHDGNMLPDTLDVGGGVTMTFLSNESFLTRVHIAADAVPFAVPPHWHEAHEEIHRVILGQVSFTLNGVSKIYGPEDGEIRIPRRAVHSIASVPGIEAIFEERTDPMDEEKELFFRNLLPNGGGVTNLFALLQICYYGDTRPALPGGFWVFEKLLVTILGYYIAPLLGYHRTYESIKKL